MAIDVALLTRSISRPFGALRAVDDLDLAIPVGQRRAIIGPNGAGKTTLFNVVSGELPCYAGSVFVKGNDVTRLSREARVRCGLGRIFQQTNLFPNLSPFDSVRLSVQRRMAFSRSVRDRRTTRLQVADRVHSILDRVGLGDRAHMPLRELSYGFQRLTEVAVALGTSPSVLLLDEPTAGLSPAATQSMIELLARLPDDLTLVIIEHDMDVVFAVASWITVMHQGRVFADGPPLEIQANAAVQEIYFG